MYSVHSPFVFSFITETIEDDREYYIFEPLESYRQLLLNSDKFINVSDHGAGSHFTSSSKRKISDIVKRSVSKPKQLKFLFRLVRSLKTKQILEFGSCIGLSAAYLKAANKKADVITVEGSHSLYKITCETSARFGLSVQSVHATFDQFLQNIDQNQLDIDFFYLDGNHQKEATLEYIEKIKPLLNRSSCVVLDDIYWSKEMYEAWKNNS